MEFPVRRRSYSVINARVSMREKRSLRTIPYRQNLRLRGNDSGVKRNPGTLPHLSGVAVVAAAAPVINHHRSVEDLKTPKGEAPQVAAIRRSVSSFGLENIAWCDASSSTSGVGDDGQAWFMSATMTSQVEETSVWSWVQRMNVFCKSP